MKSPFPGMDPYLEQFWPDLHASLIIYMRDQIEEQLPGNFIARVEERVVLETEEDAHVYYPDVKITERPGRGFPGGTAVSRGSVVEPVIVRYRPEPATETFINILGPGPAQRLITVIELLSLTNKLAGPGQRQYQSKQEELAKAGVSLVEIDLLRLGRRVLSVAPSRIPPRARTTYQACVRKGWQLDEFAVYPIPLRNPLPAIAIPLRRKDAEVRLELQAVLEQAYRKGRYFLTIDYAQPPDPPLSSVDAKWARSLFKTGRKRKSS